MIIEQKEIYKLINEGLRSIKKGIELAKKNIVVEVIKQVPKVRKPRKTKAVSNPQSQPEVQPTEKPKRTRKTKLPNLDQKGYMNERGKAMVSPFG